MKIIDLVKAMNNEKIAVHAKDNTCIFSFYTEDYFTDEISRYERSIIETREIRHMCTSQDVDGVVIIVILEDSEPVDTTDITNALKFIYDGEL